VAKTFHEIRDPIHVFIRLDSHERLVLDSRPFQRLRHIQQLALTSLIYPGATHRRFEHSLGVMELAGRVFDIVTHPDRVSDTIKGLLPQVQRDEERLYWRRVLRMAALCHDIGHLPFSHAAEKDLLPAGWDHEKLTVALILSDEMKEIWLRLTPPLRPDDVVKLAVGPKKAPDLPFNDWETLLAEIIIGDAFGVDRMDYLLRDSYHAGVAYGRFDHYRLIDTLRILPPPARDDDQDRSIEPSLGVEKGGLLTAEALLLARYFMYSQVYFHPVRRIYDSHLKDFLASWLPGGRFSTGTDEHLGLTDNEVLVALRKASSNPSLSGHEHAVRIIKRKHFKVLYERNPDDVSKNPAAAEVIYKAAVEQFGYDKIKIDQYIQRGGAPSFPVLMPDERTVDSLSVSQVLSKLPLVATEYVFCDPNLIDKAREWLNKNIKDLIELTETEE
jgi:HD superfamily phosphohydrolase